MTPDKKIEARAEKYGYCGLFALNDVQVLQDRMAAATRNRDAVHLTLCLGLLINRMAYDRAAEVIKLEARIKGER